MEQTRYIIKQNWLTLRPSSGALSSALLWSLGLALGTALYLSGSFSADLWMPASAQTVFTQGQVWRAWSTLFAHADFAHMGGNLLLFFPFAYYLSGHFGSLVFPFAAFLFGGAINLIVLKTMPEQTWLIGASGVVHWMGGAWITLGLLIDRRDSLSRRIMRAVGVSVILFVPDTFRANVSYSSHFIGYVLGVVSAMLYYLPMRHKFRKAEVLEEIQEEETGEWEEWM